MRFRHRLVALSRNPVSFALTIALVGAPIALISLAGCGGGSNAESIGRAAGYPSNANPTGKQILRGRYIVTTSGCADCHTAGTNDDPNDPLWLAGHDPAKQGGAFQIGPYKIYAANLTPDPDAGLGSVTPRQLFNALRYGLDPKEAPDAVITSTTPGVGNFPADPEYLPPPMPWKATRHWTDDDTWSVVAYLKRGLKPNPHETPEGDESPDGWRSFYAANPGGPFPLPAYPAASETGVK